MLKKFLIAFKKNVEQNIPCCWTNWNWSNKMNLNFVYKCHGNKEFMKSFLKGKNIKIKFFVFCSFKCSIKNKVILIFFLAFLYSINYWLKFSPRIWMFRWKQDLNFFCESEIKNQILINCRFKKKAAPRIVCPSVCSGLLKQ